MSSKFEINMTLWDNIDFTELKWDRHMNEYNNPNNFSNWYYKIANKNSKYLTPKSQVIKLSETDVSIIQDYMDPLSNKDRGPVTRDDVVTLLRYRVERALSILNLDKNTGVFIKNGTYSHKFHFDKCTIYPHETDDLARSIILKFLDIDYNAYMMSAGGHTEIVIRELIEDKYGDESLERIYYGMPIRREYRVFYNFDTHKIRKVSNYWDATFMIDSNTLHPREVVAVTRSKEYVESKFEERAIKLVDYINEVRDETTNLSGEWSIDFMEVRDKIYLIDMAVAEESAYFCDDDKVLEYYVPNGGSDD